MKNFRKCWNDETKQFLLDHKQMNDAELTRAFNEKYPELAVSYYGIKKERSRLGIPAHKPCSTPEHRHKRPVGFIDWCHSGRVRIKVAEPAKYESLGRWLWKIHYPEDEIKKGEQIVFLDSNKRNWNKENLIKMTSREMAIFLGSGGYVKGDPELTKHNILQVRLKLAMLDAGEKAGLVVNYGGGRKFKDEVNKKAREERRAASLKMTPEEKGARRARARACYQRIMADPERAQRLKDYQRAWKKKNREEKRNARKNSTI